MGSEVIPAIVLRRPLGPSLPLLLLFLVFFTVASCAGQDDFEDEVPDDSTRLRPHQIQELKRRVLQGLGLSRFPDVSKVSIPTTLRQALFWTPLPPMTHTRNSPFNSTLSQSC